MKRMNKIKLKWKLYGGIALLVVFLNITAWNSRAFCDWYIAHIFPLWVNTYGRVTGLFSFSVGEGLIVLGVGLVAAAVIITLLLLILTVLRKSGKKFLKFCRGFYQMFAWILLSVCMVMTLNCFILYHGSSFSEKYFGADKGEYSLEELIGLRNFVVGQCNELAVQIPRNADGTISYPDDMAETAKAAMKKLGKTYKGLSGFYPTPKPLVSSDFMSQQYMAGYYFPFSMEANYNDVMYVMNKPSTFCHELAHLKGYIYEDEANFIGYLACVQSEDIYFQYSGYLSVLYYLDNDFYDAVGRDLETYRSQPLIAPQVHADNIFLTQEEWDRIERKALLDTEVVDAVSDSFTDTSLKLNGVSDGMISYSRVVKLLLQYHRLEERKF